MQLFELSLVLGHWLVAPVDDFVDVLAFQVLVESILDLGDRSAQQRLHLRDLRPFRADLCVHFDDKLIFLARPFPPHDARIENVVPSLAALATKSSRQMLGNNDPVLGTELLNLLLEDLVLLGGPEAAGVHSLGGNAALALVERVIISNQVFDLLPALEATDLSLVGHELADPVPGVLAEHLNKLRQLLVLFLSPEDFLNWRFAYSLPFPLDSLRGGLMLFDFSRETIHHGIFVKEGKLAVELGRLLSLGTVLQGLAN